MNQVLNFKFLLFACSIMASNIQICSDERLRVLETRKEVEEFIAEAIARKDGLELRDDIGRTALFFAQDQKTLEDLMANGADVNAQSKDDSTVLHLENNLKKIKFLLAHGANPNAKAKLEQTPLHFCESPAKVKLLIDAGADINAKNYWGQTPLETIKNPEVAVLLILHGTRIPETFYTQNTDPVKEALKYLSNFKNYEDYLNSYSEDLETTLPNPLLSNEPNPSLSDEFKSYFKPEFIKTIRVNNALRKEALRKEALRENKLEKEVTRSKKELKLLKPENLIYSDETKYGL